MFNIVLDIWKIGTENRSIIILMQFSSLAAMEVVKMPTSNSANEENCIIIC